MAGALYEPDHGFYRRAASPRRDYFTSVTVHPTLFGRLLATHLDDAWSALGRPRPFRVIEVGSSDGTLARQIGRAADAYGWGYDLRYTGVEVSEPARDRAREQMPAAAFAESLNEIEAGPSAAILSNELFDAFPVRIVRREAREWLELRVAWLDGGLTLVPQPADADVTTYASRYGSDVPDGGELEMREGVGDIYVDIARVAERWVMTSVDYGGIASDVHGPRFAQGSLLAYRRHRASENVLEDPGATDLTAHVNFSELMAEGERVGATTAHWGTQADFLTGLGIGDYLPAVQRRPDVSVSEYAREREAVFQLVSPTDLGRFRVLVQTRGIAVNALRRLPAMPAPNPTSERLDK